MPRRKRPTFADATRIQEICLRHKVDPFEEMVKIAIETIPVPDRYDPEVMASLMDRYDPIEVDGEQRLQLKAMHRFEIFKECAKYVDAPKRSAEPVNENEMKLTIVLNTLQGEKPIETIELKPREIADSKPA